MKPRIMLLAYMAAVTAASCGVRGPVNLSTLDASETDSGLIKIALIQNELLDQSVQVYGAVNASFLNAQFCSIATGEEETCYQTETVKVLASKKIYRIVGNVNVESNNKMIFKANTSDGQEVKRSFTIARKNSNWQDQLQGGISPPTPGLRSLPEDQGNFELTAANGEKTSLKALFEYEYMLIESTSPGCPPCRQFARNLNTSAGEGARIREALASKKCSKAMLVDGSNMTSWKSLFSPSTYVGKASYTTGRSSMQVLRSFGYQGNSIPAFILVDRNFEIVGSSAGSVPPQFYSLCK